jgi:GNAT superfamily N-acetyltransferase
MTIQVLRGQELLSNIPEFAKLRLTIFREYPYLYEGDPALEKSYLSLFASSSDAFFIVAKIKNQVVGAISGLPLDVAQKEIRDVFHQSAIETGEYYALCEIIVLKEHRNKKIGSVLYKEFENQLLKMKRYKKVVLWQIVRAQGDLKRPNDYFSLDNFWCKKGFIKHPEFICYIHWKEISDKEESSHRFEFWIKELPRVEPE